MSAGSGTEVHIAAVTFMEERKLSVHWITIVPDFAVDNNLQNPLQLIVMDSLIALAASLVTAFQLVPQTLEALKDKDIGHLSKGSFVMICFSTFLWILHGSSIRDPAIIFANVVMFSCSATILALMIRKGKKSAYRRPATIRKRR